MSGIRNKWLLAFSLFLGLGTMAGAVEENDFYYPHTQVRYQSKNLRDPFVQPPAGRLRNTLGQVDIRVLKLTGVVRSGQQATALFTVQTGPHFGYLLKGGRLFSDNHQPVPGISGEIRNSDEVVLKQSDRQLVFQLHAH